MTFKLAIERTCIKCGGYVFTTSEPENAICDLCNGSWPPPSLKSNKNYQKKSIPDGIRWSVWERDNFTCQHCGSRRDLTVDHIHPESRGGELTMENAQTLCKSCNSRKGAR